MKTRKVISLSLGVMVIALGVLEAGIIHALSIKWPEVPTVKWEKVEIVPREEQSIFSRTHEVDEMIDVEANKFTYDEAQLLMRVAAAESMNQGKEGERLVMSVIMNRVKSETFPNSIEEVITQPHQFSTVTNGTIWTIEPDGACHEALAEIEKGNVAADIIAFETKKSNELDRYFDRAYEYKDHRFYKEK